MNEGIVVADLNRAGLGNYLFPWLRSAEIAHMSGRELLPPQWFQLRVGPYLRREPDKREYWRLFPREPLSVTYRRWRALRTVREVEEPSDWRDFDGPVLPVRDMRNYFSDLQLPPSWHRAFIERSVRPGVLAPPRTEPYVAMHVRLGDFQPATDAAELHDNNRSTPIAWFEAQIRAVRARYPSLAVIVASDGTDREIAPLMAHGNTARAEGSNALHDMLILADAVGIVGSRSTFSAWGAFLGEKPMLVQAGGNAYRPHARVFESRGEDATERFVDSLNFQ